MMSFKTNNGDKMIKNKKKWNETKHNFVIKIKKKTCYLLNFFFFWYNDLESNEDDESEESKTRLFQLELIDLVDEWTRDSSLIEDIVESEDESCVGKWRKLWLSSIDEMENDWTEFNVEGLINISSSSSWLLKIGKHKDDS